jgi:hypothetical protein
LPLPDAEINLPSKLQSPVTGGSDVWEHAQVALGLGETLPEFEERPQEQQNWAIATWRTMRRISTIELLESEERKAT